MNIEAGGDLPPHSKEVDRYKFSRVMYIIEAAIEYFVSIAVGTVYLARITAYIGFSDALTGVLSSFVSLGCGFQIIAIFLANKKPVKRWVTAMHLLSQLLFTLLYIVPVFKLTQIQKSVLFISLMLSAQIIHNVINSPKINWFMALVNDDKRGRFTADKEIVSLIGGMIFSYALGMLIDGYEAVGNMRAAFIACGGGLFVLTLLHTATLVLSKEKPIVCKSQPIKLTLKKLFANTKLFKIIAVSVLWNMASFATLSFTGTYQVKELAFSTTFSSTVIIVGSFMRAVFSRPIGAWGDKTSFVKMLSLCFVVEAVAYSVNAFTAPSNGKVLYFIFYILNCIGMAGISNATINLIYDYVEINQRTGALALQQTFAGFAGFFATVCLSPIVDVIQKNGNQILGFKIYAQQLTSVISLIITVFLLVYLNTVIKKLKRVDSENMTKELR